MYMDDTFMCMDKLRLMCMDGRIEWMRLLCMIIVYDCIYV
jgi:hypothetical protein